MWFRFLGLLLIFAVVSPKAEAAFGIDRDHPALKICSSISNVSSIINVYSSTWPSIQVLPFLPGVWYGVVTGMTTRTSVVGELCNLLQDLEAADVQRGVLLSGKFLNDLTDKKWTHHLDFTDRTWNLANSVYDFEKGEQRKGALSSASTHRDIADYMKTSYSWFNKTFNGDDAKLKSRGDKEQEMNQFAGIAYRRAILAEANNCPAGYGDTNYEKVYKIEIKPWENKRNEAQDDLNFYRTKLLQMAPKFMNDQAEMNEYVKGIENMLTSGTAYEVAYAAKTDMRTVPNPTKVDKNTGKPRQDQKAVTTQTQVWTVKNFPDIYDQFRKRWSGQWSSWVTAQFLQRTEGLLDDPQGRVEEQFRDLAYECNSSRLMNGVSLDRADYAKLQEERVAKCKADVRMNQKKAENLLNYYVNQMQTTIYQLKQANANIWTKESYYLGTMRAVNTKDSTEGFVQEKITCSDQPITMAEMQQLQLKQQAVNVEYKEFIAKQYLKKTSLMTMEAESEAQQAEEIAKRKAFAEEQAKDANQDLKNNISPVPVKGGI